MTAKERARHAILNPQEAWTLYLRASELRGMLADPILSTNEVLRLQRDYFRCARHLTAVGGQRIYRTELSVPTE